MAVNACPNCGSTNIVWITVRPRHWHCNACGSDFLTPLIIANVIATPTE